MWDKVTVALTVQKKAACLDAAMVVKTDMLKAEQTVVMMGNVKVEKKDG